MLSGVDSIKLGNLRPTRDLVFVKDTVRGFVEIAKSESAIGEEINIATQNETSVGQVAEKLINMIKPGTQILTDEARIRPELSEVERLLGANGKIKRLTGWQPQYDLEKGLVETISWFRNGDNMAHYKAGIYNL